MTKKPRKPILTDDEVTPIERPVFALPTHHNSPDVTAFCPVCGTHRGHLAPAEACPVDGYALVTQ